VGREITKRTSIGRKKMNILPVAGRQEFVNIGKDRGVETGGDGEDEIVCDQVLE
jgi:hypothetical protein